MSQSNLDVVRLLYAYSQDPGDLVAAWQDEEWTRNGLEAFKQLADPDFEFVLVAGEAVAGDVHPGMDGLLEGMREWLSDWESYEVQVEELLDQGDRVLVLTRERGVSRLGKVPVTQEGAVLYTFRAGKLLRIETYLDRATGLAAVEAQGSR